MPAAAQQAAPVPVPAQTPVDEKTLKFSDTPGANGAQPGTAPAPGAADLSFWDFARMIVILVVVIGLIYGFVYFLRKLSGQPNLGNSPIKVLSTTVLQGSRALYLVEVGNEILLVGSGDGSVNLIKAITDQETIDNLRLAASQAPTQLAKGQFLNFLKKFLGKPEPKDQGTDDPVGKSADFLKQQRDRLNKL